MAPRRQPKTLRVVAKERVVNLTLEACFKVEKTSGSYRPSDCAKIVQKIQEHIETLPENLLNEVCQVIQDLFLFWDQNRFALLDKKLGYALVMHKNLDKIRIGCDTFFHSKEMQCFWNGQIRSMSKLCEIHFQHCCDVSVVSSITESCPNLKKITLTPSIMSSRPTEAISLLTRCKQLRYIDCCRVTTNSNQVVEQLLESLTDLEIFLVPHNTSLGGILTRMKNNRSLKLRNFSENRATPTHIDSVIALCPCITVLKLQPVSVEAFDEIMEKLANSSFKIQTLELIFNFPNVQSCFESFLESKGAYLRSLEIVFKNQWIPFDVVRSIGEFCPHLEELRIKVKKITREFDLHESSTPIVGNSEIARPFQNLSTLELSVKPLVFKNTPVFNLRIVHYCLENAVHLKSLQLEGVLKPGITFDEFVKIFGTGRVQELKYLDLCCYSNVLKKEMIQFLYESFQQLTCLELAHIFPPSVERYLFELMQEVKNNNIDFAIKYAFLPTALAAHHLLSD